MIFNILPYLFIIFLSFFFSFDNRKKNERLIIFCLVFVLFFISIIRFNVGADYQTYIEMFEYINYNLTLKDLLSHTEPLFFLLNKIISYFTSNSYYLFFFTSLIIYTLLFKSIQRLSINGSLSVFLFIVTTYYFISLNQIRQSIALMIFLYSLSDLISGNNKKFILLNLIGFLFHYSAIVTFLALLLKKINFKKIVYFSILIISILLSSKIDKLLSDRLTIIDSFYSNYLSNDHFTEKNNVAILKQIIPNIIIILSIIVVKKFNNKDLIIFNLYFFSVVYLNVFFGKNIFIRPVFYFDIILIFYLPIFINTLFSDRYQRLISQVFFSIYFIILTFAGIFVGGGQGVVPFNYYFQ